MSRRRRSHYRPSLGWILGVAFEGTLTRLEWPVQEFTRVRCCGSPRASSPHGLAAPASRVSRRTMLHAVASGSRLLPTRPVKDFHLQSSAHAGHTSAAALRSAAPAFDARYTGNERGLDCAPIWSAPPRVDRVRPRICPSAGRAPSRTTWGCGIRGRSAAACCCRPRR
jgi:hypothetical protein